MSYEQKYLKYKNKYLALKTLRAQRVSTNSAPANSAPANSASANNSFLNDSATETVDVDFEPRIVSLVGGGAVNSDIARTPEIEDSISSVFEQAGGKRTLKESVHKKRGARHFFKNDSDSDLTSSDTLSVSNSEFSSSDSFSP